MIPVELVDTLSIGVKMIELQTLTWKTSLLINNQ